MLSGLPPDASDPLGTNTVTGNLFEHNHNAAVYHVCGPSGHGPCADGQLDMEQGSNSFLIADNEFRYGVLDEDPSLARDYRIASASSKAPRSRRSPSPAFDIIDCSGKSLRVLLQIISAS